MKVITLKQPWATLVVKGLKKYEFRSWKYSYRGEILIHAGQGVDKEALERLKHLNLEYPSKKIIGKATIKDCIKLDKELSKKINSENSLIYGNKKRDGYAWELTSPKEINIDKTIPGKQGIWNYDIEE